METINKEHIGFLRNLEAKRESHKQMRSLKVAASGRREWGKEGSGDCTLSLAVLQDFQNSIHTLRRRLKASAKPDL